MTLTVNHDSAHDACSSDDIRPHKKSKITMHDQTALEAITDVPDPAHAASAIDDVLSLKKSKNVEDPQNQTAPDDLHEVPGESPTVDDAPPYKKSKIVVNPPDDVLSDEVVRILTNSGFGETDFNVLENAPPTKKYRVTGKQPG